MWSVQNYLKKFSKLTDLTRNNVLNKQLDQSNNKTIKIDIQEITLISKTTSDGLLRISTRSVFYVLQFLYLRLFLAVCGME